MNYRIPIAIAAVAAVIVGVFFVTRSDGPDSPRRSPGQYQGAVTTTAPPGPAVTVDNGPRTDEEFADAEAGDEPAEELPKVSLDLTKVDRSDPVAVSLAWGCAYRASPANEGSAAWVARMSPTATATARTKLDAVSENATPSTSTAAPVGSAPEATGMKDTYRVACEVITTDPDGKRVAYDSATPTMVHLVETGAGWAVDDFSIGGIDWGPVGGPGA